MFTETSDTQKVTRTPRQLHHIFNTQSPPGIGWVVALAVMKTADAVTTWIGLQAGLAEANPFARHMMAQLGTAPALAGLSVVVVVTIAGIVETTSAAFRRFDATEKFVPWLRLSCYAPTASIFAVAAGYNAALIGGVVG